MHLTPQLLLRKSMAGKLSETFAQIRPLFKYQCRSTVIGHVIGAADLDHLVEFFDSYILAVKSTATHLVYKHAISTIVPINGEVV